jgi:DnaJ-class molecular chaperone
MKAEKKTATPKLYPCSRCDGTGIVNWARHYAQGICFKCHGTKVQATKPSISVKWCIINEAGEHVYNINAPTQAKALKKARDTIAKASADFQERHKPETFCAVPYDEYWTPERMRAAHLASQGRKDPEE